MRPIPWFDRKANEMSTSTRVALTLCLCALGVQPLAAQAPASVPKEDAPLYLLTYDHGGLILWGSEHFAERLRDAAAWLDKYPDFRIGLDNEAHMYDVLAEDNPQLLDELRTLLKK